MRLLDPTQMDDASLQARDPALAHFLRAGAGAIGNVATRMEVLDTGSHLFPVSINDGNEARDNCYVVSPLTTYTGYADYELMQLGRPWLTGPLRLLARGMGGWLQGASIDRLVQVNNWLLSTNIYPPDWDGANLPAITRLLVQTFPDHAIGFRSLNRFSNPALLEHLSALGYVAIPSRQVYLFDARTGEQAPFLRRHNSRLDATLLRRTSYRLVPGHALDDSDYPRLEQLYNLLYLDKYCPLNPHFSADWLRCGQRDGWLELTALRHPQGRIDAVVGWFANTHTLTAPVVGYDTSLPQQLGLYRLITRLCLQEAMRRRCVLNFSSGAAHFKRLRGGVPEIEYSMMYVRHLPPRQQRAWRVLGQLLHAVGVPVMRRLKL